MTLALDPHMLAAVYDALREFPPFRQWKLPPAEEVAFEVVANAQVYGYYIEATSPKGVEHTIKISAANVGHWNTLGRVMAHEMIHMHQAIAKLYHSDATHNADFRRRAKRVCSACGWDYKEFV